MNKTELLNKTARDADERLLLARAMDKMDLAHQRSIPSCTGFLSPQERASVEALMQFPFQQFRMEPLPCCYFFHLRYAVHGLWK